MFRNLREFTQWLLSRFLSMVKTIARSLNLSSPKCQRDEFKWGSNKVSGEDKKNQPDIISTLTGANTDMTHYDGLNKLELIGI